jgi:zinc protease
VITEEELTKQRKVVQNERRQSYENRPYGRAELVVPEVMYPKTHPYHWPTIGSHADLEAASVEDVRGFFSRFYLPSNASLVIAGDFEPAEARALVDRYFGWQARRPPPPRVTAAPVTMEADHDITVTDRVQLPRLRMAWHSPALYAPGDADLDMAAHVLGGGKSSRLYKTLVFDRRIAQDVAAYQGSQLLGSLFQISATAKPGTTLAELGAAVDEELHRLASEGPTEQELERARNSHLADFFKGLDHLQTRADLLNHYQHLLGDPGSFGRDIARYEATTVASIRKALAAVTGGKRLVLKVMPDENAPASLADESSRGDESGESDAAS